MKLAIPVSLVSCIMLVAGLLCPLAHSAPTAQPNIVLILVDDLGWTDLGCYGSSFYDTPNLDKFAESSVRFTSAYAASPVCSPTRAAILSGKNPARLQITDWIPGMIPMRPQTANRYPLLQPPIVNQLPHEETTIAETLQSAGYQTFYAGKWHLGEKRHWPESQGFEINRGGHDKGSPPGAYYSPYKNPVLEDGPTGEYLTDRLASETIEFIEQRDKDRPFFAYLAFYTVHTPIQGCNKYDELYRQRADGLPALNNHKLTEENGARTRVVQDNPEYAAMVRSMDENVGRVLNFLESEGLGDDTIVIFTSDNGGLSTQGKGGPTSVLPLRAGKGWCYEGGIRIPLLIRAPGISQDGTDCDVPTISMDLYPTILDCAGVPRQPEQHRDGISLAGYLRSPAETLKRTLVWHFPHYHASAWTPGSAIRQGDWKLIEFYEQDVVELYNLADDLGEQHNLADTDPEQAELLLNELHQSLDSMGALYPEQNPNFQR